MDVPKILLLYSDEWRKIYSWLQPFGEIDLFHGNQDVNLHQYSLLIIPSDFYGVTPDDFSFIAPDDVKVDTFHRQFFLKYLKNWAYSIPVLALGHGADAVWISNNGEIEMDENAYQDKFFPVVGIEDTSFSLGITSPRSPGALQPFYRSVKGYQGLTLKSAPECLLHPFLWETNDTKRSFLSKALHASQIVGDSNKGRVMGYHSAFGDVWGLKYSPHQMSYKHNSESALITGNVRGDLIANKIVCHLLQKLSGLESAASENKPKTPRKLK